MAKRKSKYYVVWSGAKPGVYATWPEANAQVAGFPGARYKSFPSKQQAEAAYAAGAPAANGKSMGASPRTSRSPAPAGSASIIRPSLSVDAACSGNPGKMEYQGVSTATGAQQFHRAYPVGTNNVGEFLGLVHGLAWCKANGLSDLPIYTDSRNAMGWIVKKKCKTTLPRDHRTEELWLTIERAEQWLNDYRWRNPILKWETKRWGEIPADFGRK